MSAAAAPVRNVPAVNPWLIAPVVALAAFMEVLDISIANVSLPHIAGDLSSSQDESTWVLTSYLVTNAIVMPISGWLSNVFGRKRFFLTCIAGFTASSLLCGLAPNLATLIVLRAVQGATGGGLQPSGQAILADSFPAEKRGMATAIYGIATVFAPAIGPTLGGWITDSFTWRWIFLINVPIGVSLFFLVTALIQDRLPAQRTRASGFSVDWPGFGFIGLSLGCLQVVLDRGQEDDWFASQTIVALTVTAAVSGVLLVWWELRHPHPMVDLRLLRERNFAVSFVLMLMLGFILFGSTFLLPAYTQSLMGYRAIDAGLALTPGGFVIMLLLPVVGRIVNKVDLRLLIAVGLVAVGSGLLWMTRFYLDSPFNEIMLARILQSSGLAFLFIPINNIAFRDVGPEKTNNVSALVNLARNFGGSIGISFASTVLTRREQFHQARAVEYLHTLNPDYADFAAHVGAVLRSPSDSMATLATIYRGAVQQATLLAYLDDFKIMALTCFALLPLLLLVHRGTGIGHSAVE
ncbi:MAG: DHA2 family efflux MFS transporter permease subunit [Nevskia sp.]|nr:DHA2 family efflux MFS transporter permease subunit [Nevskia sp.]